MARAQHPSVETEGSDPQSAVADEKKFPCTHPGCQKRFTRAEHVQRHALNHTSGQFTCLDCRAHFKRQDLLKRHMSRHRQKELEADDPSTAVLNTRKRSWKTLGGQVVEKRPYLPNHDQSSSSVFQRMSQKSTGTRPLNGDALPASVRDEASLQLGPNSHHGPAGGLNSSQYHQQGNELGYNGSIPMSFDFSSYNLDMFQYDQVFQPDTASSFNMPYTTSLDYQWLFSDPNQSATQQPAGIDYIPPTQLPLLQPQVGAQDQGSIPNASAQFAISPESLDSLEHWGEVHDSTTHTSMGMQINSATSDSSQYQEPSMPLRSPISETTGQSSVNVTARKRSRPPGQEPDVPIHVLPPDPELPLSMLKVPAAFPEINDSTRERLLIIIETANPSVADQLPIREHPLLFPQHLSSYLKLYFTNFNLAYPLLHLATFDANKVEPLLLLSVLLLGATYSEKDSHQLAVCIHDVIRPSIFAHAGFSPRPQLWTLQTVLLVECFGKSRAGQQQHDMSHLFHGLLINLIRRSDCQTVQPSGPPDSNADSDALKGAWEQWSEAEQKKRLALLCFMWDTQHAVLFCQSLCMSSFELRIALPCSQSVWEAQSPASWASAWRSSGSRDDKTSFLAALKSYLNRGLPRPAKLSALSRVLLLHGLMSVAWDMQRREQTSLGVVSGSGNDTWRTTVGTAYDTWKADFDAHLRAIDIESLAVTSTCADVEQELQVFAAAYKAVYHSAKALLNMDFLDVQIYAGSRQILGRPVQQKDYIRSRQIVRRWAATTSANADGGSLDPNDSPVTTAAWHSAHILQEVSEVLTRSEALGLFHVPWCIYLATLTCWAAYHARPSRGPSGDASLDEDEIVWDPEGDMNVLVSNMIKSGPQLAPQVNWQRGTTALVWVVADLLTRVRWGIIRASVLVLRGLVPQRLINQYEGP